MLAAIVAVMGCTWQQLPSTSFGPSGATAHRRFAEWSKARVWAKLHRLVLDELGSRGELDWRCPVLIVRPDERPRLEEIRENLHARITEAEREGWLGDVEQLTVSLTATHDKISQIDASERRKSSPVFVGMPTIKQLAVREAQNLNKTD
ncbi:putative transposase of IS4/5 family DUF4096 [Streptomyces sp. BK340]|nr:putative transposase of IS4/5 family DUF4096 [Streptomyces sp. BK340]